MSAAKKGVKRSKAVRENMSKNEVNLLFNMI